MLTNFFDSQTFRDHANHPSIGRKSIFCIGVTMLFLLLFGLVLIAWLAPLDRAKLISGFVLSALGIGAGMFGTAYASAQYSKAKAHQHQDPTPPLSLSNPSSPPPSTTPVTSTVTEPMPNAKAPEPAGTVG